MSSTPTNFLESGEPFALIREGHEDELTLYRGSLVRFDTVSQLQTYVRTRACQLVVDIPFNAVKERGVMAHGDQPITAIHIDPSASMRIGVDSFIHTYADGDLEIGELTPSLTPEQFEDHVFEPAKKAILGGRTYQSVLSFPSHASVEFTDETPAIVMARLMSIPGQQYKTYVFSDGERMTGCATPERFLEVREDGTVIVNPIAGTVKKPDDIEDLPGVMSAFIGNKKEERELAMLVSEVTKMIIRYCSEMGKMVGPYLIETGAVIHTVYEIIAKLDDPKEFFELVVACMNQPTVTGGPSGEAHKIIHEIEGALGIERGSYGGSFGTIDQNSCNLGLNIRWLEILKGKGVIRFQAGAGITEGSTSGGEYNEIRAKALGAYKAIRNELGDIPNMLENHPMREEWDRELQKRNSRYSGYYQIEYTDEIEEKIVVPELVDKKVIVVNFEDDFAYVLEDMIKRMGANVEVVNWDQVDPFDQPDCDIMVMGGGPGDINIRESANMSDTQRTELHRMRVAKKLAKSRMKNGKLTLGICLGCQAIGRAMDHRSVVQQQSATMGLKMRVQLVTGETVDAGFFSAFGVDPTKRIVDQCEVTTTRYGTVCHLLSNDGNTIALQFHPEAFETSGTNINAQQRNPLGGLEILRNQMIMLVGQLGTEENGEGGPDVSVQVANGRVARRKGPRKFIPEPNPQGRKTPRMQPSRKKK